jgi:hypothetical protein
MASSIDDADVSAEKRREAPRGDFRALPDDGTNVDDDRHYQQDPDALLGSARDRDEQDQDDLLEIDQTELEELGLVLDDPHQPEPE